MRIGIVVFADGFWGGAYQYTLSMVKAFREWDGDDEFIIFGRPDNSIIQNNDKFINPRWKTEIINSDIFTRTEDFQPHLTGDGLDLSRSGVNERARDFFLRHQAELLIYPTPQNLSFECGIPYIMAIHDLQHRLQPEFPEVSAMGQWRGREYLFRNGVRYAQGILVDSEVGKEDVLNFYGDYISPDHVYPLPFLPAYSLSDIRDGQKEIVRKKYSLPENYLFYPAQFWLHKNHARLIHAIHQLRAVHKVDIPLVLVGSTASDPVTAREFVFKNTMFLAEQLGVQDLIHYLGYVPNEDMPALYGMATSLVMPTFFGPTNIPVLDAWALDCPVLTSDIRGIRDQVGDAGLLVDPKDATSIARGILNLWQYKNLRQSLIEKGRRRIGLYTTDIFRKKLYTIIDNLRDSVKPRYVTIYDLNKQGAKLFAKGDTQGALNAFTKAIETNPNFAGAHNNLAVLYWQTGQPQKAADHFSKALQIDPDDLNTVMNCIQLLKAYNKIQDAKALCTSFLQRNPDDEVIGMALRELQKITEH